MPSAPHCLRSRAGLDTEGSRFSRNGRIVILNEAKPPLSKPRGISPFPSQETPFTSFGGGLRFAQSDKLPARQTVIAVFGLGSSRSGAKVYAIKMPVVLSGPVETCKASKSCKCPFIDPGVPLQLLYRSTFILTANLFSSALKGSSMTSLPSAGVARPSFR